MSQNIPKHPKASQKHPKTSQKHPKPMQYNFNNVKQKKILKVQQLKSYKQKSRKEEEQTFFGTFR